MVVLYRLLGGALIVLAWAAIMAVAVQADRLSEPKQWALALLLSLAFVIGLALFTKPDSKGGVQ